MSLINAGANDFGGISPLTKDYVNPEKPWPHVAALSAATTATGKALVPRRAPLCLRSPHVVALLLLHDKLTDIVRRSCNPLGLGRFHAENSSQVLAHCSNGTGTLQMGLTA
jgi:hypothetical protein